MSIDGPGAKPAMQQSPKLYMASRTCVRPLKGCDMAQLQCGSRPPACSRRMCWDTTLGPCCFPDQALCQNMYIRCRLMDARQFAC